MFREVWDVFAHQKARRHPRGLAANQKRPPRPAARGRGRWGAGESLAERRD